MKKRTKEILSGVLVLCIALSAPAGTKAASTAGQDQRDRGRTAAFQTDWQPGTRISQIFSEVTSDHLSEIPSDEISEEETESMSESFPEEVSKEVSKELSKEVSKEVSEEVSEDRSEISEELSEPEITEDDNTEEEWTAVPAESCSLIISDDGELDYRSYVDQAGGLRIMVRKSEAGQRPSGKIKVKNSSLYNSDFYIELTKDGQVQQYGYDEWITYLEGCDGWINGEAEVKLSDTGRKYFRCVRVEEREIGANKIEYVFWAENPDKNVSTKDVEGGTRSYIAGKDTDAPVLKDFCTSGECYEPAGTDTEQYLAEDFILEGTFCDGASGVDRIEYTADWHAGRDPVWTEAESIPRSGGMTGFQITLTDGDYPSIAVRAYDKAGNVSEVKRLVNDADDPVRVVVDRTVPVLKFDVSAGGQPYSGKNDQWTNKDVRIAVALEAGSCPYAGVYQYEYTYVKIGENMTDVSDEWVELPVREKSSAVLDITGDRNGYYLFRAVSRAGVKTREDAKQRVLIQHQAPKIKPILAGGVDETQRKNGWYNKQSGTPKIRFEYPDYDTGVISGEYDAPVTIHYEVAKREDVPEAPGAGSSDDRVTDGVERTAVLGIMSSSKVTVSADGRKEFVLEKDDLDEHVVAFGCEDGYYTLRYWITDQAGNESEKQVYHYKIDCHEPTGLTMELDGDAFAVGQKSVITYKGFYRDTVSCSADAQYGISGKGTLGIEQVKKIGEWKDRDSLSAQDSISIAPNTRCFLYIRAEDAAGNIAEGWTEGIVVDNMAPNGAGSDKELIIEPRGANEHGFYNGDIQIGISVKDAPENDNCAALRSVTCSVGRDGTDTGAAQELFSFAKESPTEDEIMAASGFHGTQLINAAANESNEAYIEVTAVDRSGNTTASMRKLRIDVTKPEIEILFDNDHAVNGNYYRTGRIATIRVHELNFDPDAVSVNVTKDGHAMEASLSKWTSNGSEHYATLAFQEDGVYRVTASCVDLADNASDEVQSESFIIDRTTPEMTIGLASGRETQTTDRDYFNTGVTAVITVIEHNFREEDFAMHVTPVSEKGTWSHDGDIHTLRFGLEEDGGYQIACTYTDMAGNAADPVERGFVIDTAAPLITIDGVEDGSANSGAILPVIAVFDPNIELSGISVSVRTGMGDVVDHAAETVFVGDEGHTGYRLTLTDMTEKPDNIYYLTVSAHDRAGNAAECAYRFSLNRTGSVYDLTSLAQLMERQYITYNELEDLRVVEMNIDRIDEFELYVSRNGAIGYKAEYTKNISGSADSGYTYVYQVGKENFAVEGIYRLTLYSRDRAGNEVNNTMDIHGHEIMFVVDNTAPKVIIDGIEPGKMYDVEEKEIHVAITDNFKLAEAEITLVNRANEVLARWDYMELAGEDESLDITIPQHSETVSLLYRVKDAAGNEIQTFQGEREAIADFLVTTDKYVQFINKPAQTARGRILILAAAVSVAAAVAATSLLFQRRKRL